MVLKWKPINCCCIFYTANAGTKILLHLDVAFLIIAYIVLFAVLIAGQTFVVETLEILFKENWIASFGFPILHNKDKDFYKRLYEDYKEALLISLPIACLVFFLVIVPGLIALKKRKPNFLIPYLLFKTVTAFGLIAFVVIIYNYMMHYQAGHFQIDKPSPGLFRRPFQFILGIIFPTENTENHLEVSIGYVITAGFILSIPLTILHFHLVLVVAVCYMNMREEIKKGLGSKQSHSIKQINSVEYFLPNVA